MTKIVTINIVNAIFYYNIRHINGKINPSFKYLICMLDDHEKNIPTNVLTQILTITNQLLNIRSLHRHEASFWKVGRARPQKTKSPDDAPLLHVSASKVITVRNTGFC